MDATTITDEQIRELKTRVELADAADADALCAAAGTSWLDDIQTQCEVALNPRCGRHYRNARCYCAQLINDINTRAAHPGEK